MCLLIAQVHLVFSACCCVELVMYYIALLLIASIVISFRYGRSAADAAATAGTGGTAVPGGASIGSYGLPE